MTTACVLALLLATPPAMTVEPGGAVHSVQVCSDGETVAALTPDAMTLWSVQTGEMIKRVPGAYGPQPTVLGPFDADRQLAVQSRGREFAIWNATNGAPLRTIAMFSDGGGFMHDELFKPIAFSADGRWLAACSGRRTEHPPNEGPLTPPTDDERLRQCTVRVWDAETFDSIATRFGCVDALAMSSDGALVALASDDGLELWDPKSGATRRIDSIRGARALAFSPDGRRLAAASSSVTVFDVDRCIVTCRLERAAGASECRALTFTGDGGRVVAAFDGGELAVFDAQSGTTIERLEGRPDNVRSLSSSADGMVIAAGDGSGRLRVWRLDGDLPPRITPEAAAAMTREELIETIKDVARQRKHHRGDDAIKARLVENWRVVTEALRSH